MHLQGVVQRMVMQSGYDAEGGAWSWPVHVISIRMAAAGRLKRRRRLKFFILTGCCH
jgi:hypothetical protein